MEESLAIETSSLGVETLINVAKTSMSSKIVGSDSDYFAKMVVDAVQVGSSHLLTSALSCMLQICAAKPMPHTACHTVTQSCPFKYCYLFIILFCGCMLICLPWPRKQSVKSTNEDSGRVTYPVSAINVLKAHGKSARESALLNGYALNMGRASQGMPKRVAGARIACLDMNLQKTRMHMGIQARRSFLPLQCTFFATLATHTSSQDIKASQAGSAPGCAEVCGCSRVRQMGSMIT